MLLTGHLTPEFSFHLKLDICDYSSNALQMESPNLTQSVFMFLNEVIFVSVFTNCLYWEKVNSRALCCYSLSLMFLLVFTETRKEQNNKKSLSMLLFRLSF